MFSAFPKLFKRTQMQQPSTTKITEALCHPRRFAPSSFSSCPSLCSWCWEPPQKVSRPSKGQHLHGTNPRLKLGFRKCKHGIYVIISCYFIYSNYSSLKPVFSGHLGAPKQVPYGSAPPRPPRSGTRHWVRGASLPSLHGPRPTRPRALVKGHPTLSH